ncbi:MAG: DUF3836 domain-containing protein [Bacteroides sp.]|nr:DUF3836 domain-containing protein [Bacteroides sp.]
MKKVVYLKSFLLLSFFLCMQVLAYAGSHDGNYVYNTEEKDGVMVAQTVYKIESGALVNHIKYNYSYDDRQRMTEHETLKWNSARQQWEKDTCIRYTYEGKLVTTIYYKWNSKQKDYLEIPEMTVTMEAN